MGWVDIQKPIPVVGVSAPAHLFSDKRPVLEARNRPGQKGPDLLAGLRRDRVATVLGVRPWLAGLPSVR
jgi:hypothetical protein